MRGHLSGIVVENFLHDVLRDIAVDEPGAERVPPLARGQVQGLAELVADVAAPASGIAHLAPGAATSPVTPR